MISRYGLLTLIVLTGCSKPGVNENQSSDLSNTDSTIVPLLVNDQPDTLSYIGYIQKFEDNNSFYTDLYFVDNFNYDLYNEITEMGDQVIFNNDEVRRTKMDIARVGQYFNLTGLKNIVIYDSKNQKLTTGQLSHIEYFEDVIERKFVAVFQVEDSTISDPLFCIGNSDDNLIEVNFSSYRDEKLKSELIDFLDLNPDNIWSIEHYKNDNHIISATSADTTAYIIETLNNDHKVLYKSKSSEAIHGLMAISKMINGREILLAECGMPETDMMWTSVLVFNGSVYETRKDHRIARREHE
ncbi:MAG TPA: hypothetical protein VFU05_20575 [Cyclobacteriaceae bacterium]|nr:hypothetical protein [Cyclobacteriaceae bacterium]